MGQRRHAWLAVGVLCALAACQNTEPNVSQSTTGTFEAQQALVSSDTGLPAGCSDAQAVAFADATSESELAVARSVRDQLTDPSIRLLADQVIADQTRLQSEGVSVLQDQLGILPDDVGGLGEQVRLQAQRDIDRMALLHGPDLDQAFLAQQVAAQTLVVGTIDNVLAPVASTSLLPYLERSRAAAQQHLELAIAGQHRLVAGECVPVGGGDTGAGPAPAPGAVPGQGAPQGGHYGSASFGTSTGASMGSFHSDVSGVPGGAGR